MDKKKAVVNNDRNDRKLRCFKNMHFVLSAGLFIGFWFVYTDICGIRFDSRFNYIVAAYYAFISYFFSRTYNCYLVGYSRPQDICFSQCTTNFLSLSVLYISLIIVWNKWLNPLLFIAFMPVQWFFNYIWAKAADKLYFRLNPPKRTALIYRNESDVKRLKDFSSYIRNYDLSVIIQAHDETSIDGICAEIGDCNAVFVTGVPATLRNGIVKYCVEKHVQAFVLPHVGDVIMASATHMQCFSVPVLSVKNGYRTPEYIFIKRLADIIVSAAALILLSPVICVTAAAIKIEDGGPVFYRQTRLTKDGHRFDIIKFRSMRTDAEKDGIARLASENDDRITGVGRFIRACRIDEIPQLVNVIRGEMSLVGPRPERPEIAAEYEKMIPSFRLRLQVKAGITGYAQVYGKYSTDPYNKLIFDLLYINHMNFVTDLQLLFATLKILFIRESAEGIASGKTTAAGGIHEQM